jgi:predicted deacylase
MPEPFVLGGVEVPPGVRRAIELPVGRPFTRADLVLPVEVVNGRRPGPRLFVCAAIHGDEINGVEIIRRLLRRPLRELTGTLIAVPVVNVYGFISLTRYLPDRRDLNRSFPGTKKGSLAARLAHLFMEEIVARATHGIDLHTGAIHRCNLPQIRACLDQPETEQLARAFGAPVIIDANLRDGSLRQEVLERGVPMLLYEAGEALRFDEPSIRAGVAGVLAVMRALGMLSPARKAARRFEPFVAHSTQWVRAPESGILRDRVRLGAAVTKGQPLGVVADPLGREEFEVRASRAGVVIGRTVLPLVNEGDALYHVASFDRPEHVAGQIEGALEAVRPDPSFYEPAEPGASGGGGGDEPGR